MSIVTIDDRWGLRGGTAANLASVNEVPLVRELIIETDTGLLKVGDGTTHYNSLAYVNKVPAGVSFVYTTDTGSTADSDPGSGLMKWNNATQSSATKLFFDDATANTGTDLSALFTELAASSTAGIIHMVAGDGAFQVYKWTGIADGTGYFKFTVTHLCSSGAFADNITVRVAFLPMPPSSGGGGSGLRLVAQASIAGSAGDSLTLSSLSLSAGQYILEFSIKNPTAGSVNYSLFYNSDTTAANYRRSNNFGTAQSNAAVATAPAGGTTTGNIVITIGVDGKPLAVSNSVNLVSTTISQAYLVHAWLTAATITAMQFSGASGTLDVGSYIKLWAYS